MDWTQLQGGYLYRAGEYTMHMHIVPRGGEVTFVLKHKGTIFGYAGELEAAKLRCLEHSAAPCQCVVPFAGYRYG